MHHENGIDECIISSEPRRLQLDGIEDFLDGSDFIKESNQQVTIVFWPDSPTETLDEVKSILRKKGLLNIKYIDPSVDGVNEIKPEIIPDSDGDVLFEMAEVPEFPGGTDALLEFMRKNIKYPADAREKDIQGRVLVTFIVNKDGSLTEPEVVKSVDPLLDAEALRLISVMPKWKPGTQRGKPVRTKYTLPVNFRLASKYVEPTWISVELLNYLESEQYAVTKFSSSVVSDQEPEEKLESAVKDLFKGKRKALTIQYSEDNLKKVKDIIAKYPDKKVNWML